MEHSKTEVSEDDRKKMNSFERYSETIEDSEEKKKKKKKKSSGPNASVAVEKKDETEKGADVKTKDEEAKVDKKDDWSLFESSEEDAEAEPEVPENPEEISTGEELVVDRQLLKGKDAELQQEHAETKSGSNKETEVLADALLIDKLAEKVDEGEVLDEAVLDQAVAEVAEELDIKSEVSEIAEASQEAEEVPEEVETEEAAPAEAIEANPIEASEGTPDIPEEESQAAPAGGPVSSATPPVPPLPMPPVSASGGANLPPHQKLTPNFAHTPSSPNVATPSASAPERGRYGRGADMLVGGIIGYLIGRRRGRIKTEERLLPVQKSLEKKVKDLDEKITIREQKIRKLASEKVAREGEDVRKAIAEKVEAKARTKQEARDKIAEQRRTDKADVRHEAKEQTGSDIAQEQELSRPATAVEAAEEPINEDTLVRPEISETPVELPQRRPEKLASVVLASPELTEPRRVETVRQEVSKETAKEVVQKMPEAELLVAAAKIEVGGQSAKQLYEQGRVSKEDLREVVVEHVRGNGRAERLLVERLRPAASSETMERLPREGGKGGDDPSGGGAASLPPVQTGTDDLLVTSRTKHVSRQPNAMGSADAPATRPKNTAPIAWITGIVVAASILASLFL
jgi:hypothetical protein